MARPSTPQGARAGLLLDGFQSSGAATLEERKRLLEAVLWDHPEFAHPFSFYLPAHDRAAAPLSPERAVVANHALCTKPVLRGAHVMRAITADPFVPRPQLGGDEMICADHQVLACIESHAFLPASERVSKLLDVENHTARDEDRDDKRLPANPRLRIIRGVFLIRKTGDLGKPAT